ncbi:hypothetical protein H5410_051890 [Solanum commersonii]|uniref:MADS-box domain-containing protein n=1 Tax=Solanum commersonii TaxID=4109 RepID=A0A9J5X0R0_SOLCO|nr:hypothetical protein H5410_051890 [Solanum commersonii]
MDRQKIKIAKMKVKNHLQVIFSKRCSGLFKKASELRTLAFDQIRKTCESQYWWEAPIGELAYHELEKFGRHEKNVMTHASKIMVENDVGIFCNYDIKPVMDASNYPHKS